MSIVEDIKDTITRSLDLKLSKYVLDKPDLEFVSQLTEYGRIVVVVDIDLEDLNPFIVPSKLKVKILLPLQGAAIEKLS